MNRTVTTRNLANEVMIAFRSSAKKSNSKSALSAKAVKPVTFNGYYEFSFDDMF